MSMKTSKKDDQTATKQADINVDAGMNNDDIAGSENQGADAANDEKQTDKTMFRENANNDGSAKPGGHSENAGKEADENTADVHKTDAGEETKPEDEALSIKYMRLAADFQNYKRRAEKDKSEIYVYANEKIVESLLDIADNFERALEHEKDSTFETFYKGMELIFKQFTDVLSRNQVEEILITEETEFDPVLHEAVMMEEGSAPENGGTTEILRISEVFKKGYRFKEKVVRHATVKVRKDYI